MTAHSVLGASSMYRWSKCPGSVRQSAGIPNTSSAYADEGTDAHTLAAYCLNEGKDSASYVNMKMHLEGREFLVTADMAEAVEIYLATVRGAEGKRHIEQRFDLSNVHPGCFGTADAVVWDKKSKLLTVIDYKHGAGIPVGVFNNLQLRYYALGALLSLGYPAENVTLTIVQPRCDHPDGPVRSETIPALDLLDFAADLVAYAKATEAPDAPLHPGEHCRFCPAGKSNACPEVKNKAQAIAKTVFTPMQSYDPAELARCLDARETVKAWLKNLDEFAYAEAEAGRCPPGYKLVEKVARRKWPDVSQMDMPVPVNWYERAELKSPAKLEKMGPDAKKFVAENAIKESSGHVLVPEDDKRPAVTRLTAKDAFTAVEHDPFAT